MPWQQREFQGVPFFFCTLTKKTKIKKIHPLKLSLKLEVIFSCNNFFLCNFPSDSRDAQHVMAFQAEYSGSVPDDGLGSIGILGAWEGIHQIGSCSKYIWMSAGFDLDSTHLIALAN